MLDHVSIQCADVTASGALYDAVLAPTGGTRIVAFGEVVGYGVPPVPRLLARPPHDRGEAATAAGAEVVHEPRLWPAYHETYDGAFARDPDGNDVEVVCHTPG